MTATNPDISRFREFLESEGLKYTRQRRAIALVFYGADKHLSLQELLDLAKRAEPALGYATVYRTMRLLADGGLAIEHQFDDGHARYEPATEGEHHDHIICKKCGKIIEFEHDEIERLQEEVARAHGMRVLSHRHEIYGECVDPECEGL